jgi:hypothetical protein
MSGRPDLNRRRFVATAESKLAFLAPKNVQLPTAITAFPHDIYTAPRRWTGGHIQTSFATTGWTGAVTGLRGSSRRPSRTRFALASDRCVSCWRGEPKVIDPNAPGWFEKLRARWTAGG